MDIPERIMRFSNIRVLLFPVIVAGFIILIHSVTAAQEDAPPQPPTELEEEQAAPPPGLSELVAANTKLNERLAALEKEIAELPNYTETEDSYSHIQSNLDDIKLQLEKLIFSKSYSYQKFEYLRDKLDGENALLTKFIKPLGEDLSKFESSQQELLNERELWSGWRSYYAKDESFSAAEPIFEEAEETISKALSLISDTLKRILEIREGAGVIRTSINSIKADVAAASPSVSTSLFGRTAAPMYSHQYYSEFNKQLFEEFRKGLPNALDRELKLVRQSRPSAVFILALLIVFSIGLILRYRRELGTVEQLRFLVSRPFSAGLFIGFFVVLISYEVGVSSFLKSIFVIVAGITAIRLLSKLTKNPLLTRLLGTLVIILVLVRILPFMDIPLPLYRLIIIGGALGGLILHFRRRINISPLEQTHLYKWTARIGVVILFAVLVAEILGYSNLAGFVFIYSILSLFFIFQIWIFKMMFSGLLEMAVRSSALQRIDIVREKTPEVLGLLVNISNLFLLTYFVTQLLELWTDLDSPYAALLAILSFGISLGPFHITVGLIVMAAIIFYGSFIVSSILGAVFDEAIFKRSGVDRGIRASYRTIIKYVFVFVGFLLALGVLGFDLGNIALFGGALGIGIGFGLQNIVNNFVSGLILLFERPVKVGDIVTIEGDWGEIKKIGLRSSLIKRFDHSDLIVPNSLLTSNSIINWSLTDRFMRITIPVGVAYGSKVPLVMKTLSEAANSITLVATDIAPQVIFMNFGESSLDFELRVWATKFNQRILIISELHQEIDRRFREAGIVIPFPQRDLHLVDVPDTPSLKPTAPEAEVSFQAPSGSEVEEDDTASEQAEMDE
jgi:potassium efflux system protein